MKVIYGKPPEDVHERIVEALRALLAADVATSKKPEKAPAMKAASTGRQHGSESTRLRDAKNQRWVAGLMEAAEAEIQGGS